MKYVKLVLYFMLLLLLVDNVITYGQECNNTGTTSGCQDTIALTCTVLKSFALIWTINGTDYVKFLTNIGESKYQVNITKDITCTAYKTIVDDAIQSNITCSSLIHLFEQITFVCKSDSKDVCTKNFTCHNDAPTTQTTPPASLDIGSIVGGVIGGITIIIFVIKTIIKRCGRSWQVNDTTTGPGGHHGDYSTAGLKDTTQQSGGAGVSENMELTKSTEIPLRNPRVEPGSAVSRAGGDVDNEKHEAMVSTTTKPYFALEGTGNQSCSMECDDLAGNNDGSKSAKDPALENENTGMHFEVPSVVEQCADQKKPKEVSPPKSQFVLSEISSVPIHPTTGTAIEDTGNYEVLVYKDVLCSQPHLLYEAGDGTTLACVVMMEPPKKMPLKDDGVFCPSLERKHQEKTCDLLTE